MPPLESIQYIKPELILAGLVLLLILANLWQKVQESKIVLITITLSGLFVAFMALLPQVSQNLMVFNNNYAIDLFARFFKLIFLICGVITVLILFHSSEIERSHSGEFCALLAALILAMFLVVSSTNLLMLYLALEFVSIISYILTGFKRQDRRAAEASLKYVIYGGVVSGIMLFGMSYFYGLFGTLDMLVIKEKLLAVATSSSPLAYPLKSQAGRLTLLAAAVFTLAGFAYKMAAVPFHMWCPDVYEGAPTPFTAFLSVGPKVAGIAVLCRFLVTGFFDNFIDSKLITDIPWAQLLGILALVTMTVGNLSAISQKNIKRLLAYSSIAHCGYLLMGLSALSGEGLFAFCFYAVVYLFMNFGAFLIVIAVREKTGREDIDVYFNLGQREPFIAAAFTIYLFSLTGIPPLAGFIGKFYLFVAVINKAQIWYYLLALVGVLNSVISLYYYAAIVKVMYFESLENPTPLEIFGFQKLLAFIILLPLFILGIYWQPLAEKIVQWMRFAG